MDKAGQFKYYFVLRDHLGNTRVTFSDLNNDDEINEKEEVIQINNYYAFGLNMEGNWNGKDGANKYQYNGKEWNDDFGLGWNDYGARFYDPAVGRFFTKDRFAEKYSYMTPYQYASNNPAVNIDINGDSTWVTNTMVTKPGGQQVQQSVIHVRGKILDASSGVRIGGGGCAAARDGRADLAKGINDELNGETGAFINSNGLITEVRFDAQFTVANSMDDVAESDHLLVVVDEVLGKGDPKMGGGGSANSATGIAEFFSKIGYIEKSSSLAEMVGTGVHEFGHNLGEGHYLNDGSGNHMSYESNRTQFNTSQMSGMRAGAYNPSTTNRAITPATQGGSSHPSTNDEPWRGTVKAGQVIPRPITNSYK